MKNYKIQPNYILRIKWNIYWWNLYDISEIENLFYLKKVFYRIYSWKLVQFHLNGGAQWGIDNQQIWSFQLKQVRRVHFTVKSSFIMSLISLQKKSSKAILIYMTHLTTQINSCQLVYSMKYFKFNQSL